VIRYIGDGIKGR